MRNDNVNGLTSDIETLLGVDLEEVSAHKSEDGDAVVKNVFRIGSR